MVIGYGVILAVVIAFFGLYSVIRGVRSTALTTAAICFAFVVVVLSGSLLTDAFQRLGLVLNTPDTQAVFLAILFIFTLLATNRALKNIVPVPTRGLTRGERLGGLGLGLLNGFFVMAMIQHYLNSVLVAAAGGSNVSVGVPALSFSHPTPDTWSVKLIPTTFTLLPPSPSSDLWAKVPVALVLLLLLLAFIFFGTLYNRLSGNHG
ncbi:MAG TPA: hypothetical protein VFE42_31405 [Chloroflexota bacterium]|nr:hypothetical protein [Chloroflexota bacterium]